MTGGCHAAGQDKVVKFIETRGLRKAGGIDHGGAAAAALDGPVVASGRRQCGQHAVERNGVDMAVQRLRHITDGGVR